ncbi:site-specific integrase [Yersinia canariae]|uniref:site-specific integrase n=1 Tax=Yersinia canariae TaxID=2607663 RepID=UPI00119E627E|nr:site-specific integrase [Yersinia canariae]
MIKYPTGVENHGGKLRLWFIYKGIRVREALGVPDTLKNRRIAGDLRSSICFTIKTGTFDYTTQFPNSPNLVKFGQARKDMTLHEMSKKWLSLKEMDLTINAFSRYKSFIFVTTGILGTEKLVSSVNQEDILSLRRELLTGFQMLGHHQTNRAMKKGRSVPTVNVYISCLGAMLAFAFQNGYSDKDPMIGVSPLKKAKPDPDPLTKDEYQRLLSAAPSEQMKNVWVLAINTGMRHGEICALSWEDIDTKNWTITIRRNMAVINHFTPPKTDSGNREIKLTSPAIEALKSQMAMTRLSECHEITVHLREFSKKRVDQCTFVFCPKVSARNGNGGYWYSPGSIGTAWNTMLKKAGIKHRKAYESRHTFACWALSAGANPNFVANQMGHASAQMIYNVYGKWMAENNLDQIAILNASFNDSVPLMPQTIAI